MQNKMFNENGQKGVSLIITFFIMLILLAVILSVSVILYSEIKVIRNMGNSMVSFYAAESGVEKVLFYDFNVLPQVGTDGGVPVFAKRGMCSICDTNSPFSCDDPGDDSLACLSCEKTRDTDCDPATCSDCEISFLTNFDNRSYNVITSVTPSKIDVNTSDFSVNSLGTYGGTSRKIEIYLSNVEVQEPIQVLNACANPKFGPQGASIKISARIKDVVGATVSLVKATIRDPDGKTFTIMLPFKTGIPYTDGLWEVVWQSQGNSSTGSYYVDLDITDSASKPNTKHLKNLPSCQI